MDTFIVLSFYKFVAIPKYQELKEPFLAIMHANGIKGTIILASEGINGSFCAKQESLQPLLEALAAYPGLDNLPFRRSVHSANPFSKAKIKLRPEIVTLAQGEIDVENLTGNHVMPEHWDALIADSEVLVIDTRNNYEVELGTFKGAINPKTENFRDFPEYVEQHLGDKKNRKIAMFCTGGIRCEKSTAYLKKQGFENVYQLHGGILNYLETIPATQSSWEGSCFVFDERVAIDKNLISLEKGSIDPEWKNNSKKKFHDNPDDF